MSQIFNIDFSQGILGPNADEIGGFYSANIPTLGNATALVDNILGRIGGYGMKVVSDSRQFYSNGLTSIIGYDDRPLSQLGVDTHPVRPKDGDAWWYSFSFKIGGSAWAKGKGFEPYIFQFKSIDSNENSANSTFSTSLPLLSFSIDSPGTAPLAISDWFRSTTTPKLFINHLVPSNIGATTDYFNNISNYSHAELGKLNFETWYDVKFYVEWSAYGHGLVKVWLKSQSQNQFTDAPTYIGQNIQNLPFTSLNLCQSYLAVGYEAILNSNVSNNFMQNTLYFDNIVGGSNELDVDLYDSPTALPGNLIFNGSWDGAVNKGSRTNKAQVLANNWLGYNIAPNGAIFQGTADVDARHSISVVNDITSQNSPYAARFEVRDGELLFGQEQTEVYSNILSTQTNSPGYIPTNGGTGWISWSSYIDSSVVSNSYYADFIQLKYPDNSVGISVGILSDTLYLKINKYNSDHGNDFTTIYPWTYGILYQKNQWLDFKLKICASPGTAGYLNLWFNGNPQLLDYSFGTANGNSGINTYTYTGPTLRPAGTSTTIGSNFYLSAGIFRDPNIKDPWVVYHDNVSASYEGGTVFVASSVIYPFDIPTVSEVNAPIVGTALLSNYPIGNASTAKQLEPAFIQGGNNSQVLITGTNGLVQWSDLMGLITALGFAQFPPGAIVETATTAAPAGWLLCDGSAVSRTTYAALFAAIGTNYGSGDGSTTFNLPDFKGRVGLSPDNMGGSSAGRVTGATALNVTGGAETHTLSLSQIPSHNHSGSTSSAGSHNHGGATGNDSPDHSHQALLGGSLSTVANVAGLYVIGNANTQTTGGASNRHTHTISSDGSHTHTISSDGSGGSHNNLQPYITANKMIKT